MEIIQRGLAFDMLFGSNKIDPHLAINAIYDSIHDEYKSRICKSCRWYQNMDRDLDSTFKECKLYEINHGEDYGCNKWELK